MRFTIFQDSRQGDRAGNEDRVGYSYSKDVLLMVIADGMGGHMQGEVAAEIAVTEITRRFQQEARNRLRRPSDFLVSVINSAHRAIVSHAVAENLLECPRTTCVVCLVQDGSACWAHAGDSRLYVLRGGQARGGHPGPLARAADDRLRRDHAGGGGDPPRAQQDLQLPGRRGAPGHRRRQRVRPADGRHDPAVHRRLLEPDSRRPHRHAPAQAGRRGPPAGAPHRGPPARQRRVRQPLRRRDDLGGAGRPAPRRHRADGRRAVHHLLEHAGPRPPDRRART